MPGKVPSLVRVSLWQIPQAWTLMRTWPAAGSGTARSMISRGPFWRMTWTTRMVDIGYLHAAGYHGLEVDAVASRALLPAPPVLDFEALRSTELPDVAGHQHESERHGMAGDLQVVRTDDGAVRFQRGTDAAVGRCGVAVEVHTRDLAEEDVEPLVVPLLVDALLGAVAQLGDRHRADAQVVGGSSLQPPGHGRVAAGQVVDADVRVEQVLHGSVEVRAGLGRPRLAGIREVGGAARQVEEHAAPSPPGRLEDHARSLARDQHLALVLEAVGLGQPHRLAAAAGEALPPPLPDGRPPGSPYIREVDTERQPAGARARRFQPGLPRAPA